MLSRRGLIFGAAAVAAPAIIRPGLLMPVKRMLLPDDGISLYSMPHPGWDLLAVETRDLPESSLIELLEHVWREARVPLRARPTHLVGG